MDLGLKNDKDLIRQAMLDRRGRLPISEQEEAGKAMAEKLFTQKEIFEATSVGLYSSYRGEVPTAECFRRLRAGARRVCLPRIGESGCLEFVKVDDELQCRKGSFGILEPEPNLPVVDLRELQVLVIPGVAFDQKGRRIGWGKGYYDKVLKGFSGKRIGLAYDFQVLEEIPAGPKDEKVDLIITETRVIACTRGPVGAGLRPARGPA